MFYSAILPAENIIDTLKQHPQLSWEALRLHSSCILLVGGGEGRGDFLKGQNVLISPTSHRIFWHPPSLDQKKKWQTTPHQPVLTRKVQNKASKKADENLQIKIEWPDQLSMKRKGNCKSAYCMLKKGPHTWHSVKYKSLQKRRWKFKFSISNIKAKLPARTLHHRKKKKWLA